MPLWDMLLRLGIAAFCGGIIGIERGKRRRAAGFRTHMLVCVGAALTMVLGTYLHVMITGGLWPLDPTYYRTDVSRFGAQVINGIGFLGAGTIIVTNRQEVKGLTTAAGLWVAAGIGMAIGGGLYIIGTVTTIFALIGLEVFGSLFVRFHARNTQLVFTTTRHSDLVKITNAINEHSCKVVNCSVIGCEESGGKRIRVRMLLYDHSHNDESWLLTLLSDFENINIEKIE